MAIFLGDPVPEENFWTLWCKGRLTEADTPTIRLGATPSGLTSAHVQHCTIQHSKSVNFYQSEMFCLFRNWFPCYLGYGSWYLCPQLLWKDESTYRQSSSTHIVVQDCYNCNDAHEKQVDIMVNCCQCYTTFLIFCFSSVMSPMSFLCTDKNTL